MDNNTYNFDYIPDRRNSDSVKWNSFDEDVLPMWVADMDFVSPEPVVRALHQRVDHRIFGYPSGIESRSGIVRSLCNAVIERLEKLYRWHVQPEEIILMPGVVTGFNLACHAFVQPDEAVMIQTPVYHPILHAAQTTGINGQQTQLSCLPDGSYDVDWDAFDRSITPDTRMFILCNPHNPVGKVFTRPELERIAQICHRKNVIICSDEIHCDLIFNGSTHTPIAALSPEVAQNTITLMAPSKTFNLAGLECSFAIIPNRDLRKKYVKARSGLVPWVNLMGLTAAEAAYREGEPWLAQVLPYLEGNRDYLYEFVNNELPGVRLSKPQGTYLAWLDCRQAGIDGNPSKFFLKTARVAFNDGEMFGPGGKGFVRLNFGCPRPLLVEALDRMKASLESLKGA